MAFTLTGCGENASSPVPLSGYGGTIEPSPLPSPSISPSPSPSVSPSPGTTGTFTGIVYDSDSYEEIQGAQVTIGGKTTLSDWVGHYEIDGLSPGTAQVTASCQGYLGYSGSMTIPTAGSTTQNVRLEPPTTVSGTVTDGTTSSPLAGVTVTLGTSTATTDKNGSYSFDNVKKGTLVITASKDGYLTHTDAVVVEPDTNDAKCFALSKPPLRKGPYLLYNNTTTAMTVLWQTYNSPNRHCPSWPLSETMNATSPTALASTP